MPALLVMRHAKSDWDAEYGGDHDRPLNDRGVESAKVMGEVLTEKRLVPGLIVSSTALRARSTAELAMASGHWDSRLTLEPGLYGTGPDEAIDIAAAEPVVERLMLVGHQPAWSLLVRALTGELVDMKTATVAVVDFAGEDWSSLRDRRGTLVTVLQPRDYL